ncbi:metallophosphoesterase family protein [Streptomyces sp. GLT-R25]
MRSSTAPTPPGWTAPRRRTGPRRTTTSSSRTWSRGRPYYYQARSRGTAATPTPLHLIRGNAVGTNRYGLGSSGGPYSFTTPQPPPGRHLLSIALCNDFHIGETTAGLMAGLPLLRGVAQEPGLAPYPEIMSRALVEEARRRGADLLLAAGDISAGGAPRDLAEAKRILDGFGSHGQDYFAVRGNHDRPRHRDAGDAFRDEFLGGARGPRTSPGTSAGCGSSGSTRTRRTATAPTPAGSATSNCPGSGPG